MRPSSSTGTWFSPFSPSSTSTSTAGWLALTVITLARGVMMRCAGTCPHASRGTRRTSLTVITPRTAPSFATITARSPLPTM